MTGILYFNSMDGASSKGGAPFLIVFFIYIRLIRPGFTDVEVIR